MKKGQTAIISIATLAAALLITAGCKSNSGGANEATAAGLQKAGERIGASGAKVDAALGSLSNMVSSPTNLPDQFAAYTSSVKDLESTFNQIDSRVASAREKGNAYFKEWDAKAAQITNAEIKQVTLDRKSKVQESFTQLKMSYQKVSDSYKPFMNDLKDIQTALTADLTVGGLTAIKGPAQKAQEHSVPLKRSITELAGEFKDLGMAMSSAAPAAAAAGSTSTNAAAK